MSLVLPGSDTASVMLLGVNSIVGWSLASQLQASETAAEHLRLICNPHTRIPSGQRWHRLELHDRASLRALLRRDRPSLIFHCAGICNVEKCEASPEFAQQINVQGMAALLAEIADDTRLVYLSSDHVFSGDSGPYSESSSPDPISTYGRSRVAAERLLQTNRPDALIVRAGLWIGPSFNGRVGHLDWLRYRTRRGLPTTVVRDEYRSAVWANQAAERVLQLAWSDIAGVRHVVAKAIVSRPALARYLDHRFAVGARIALMDRSQRPVPHLGRLDLRTRFDDPLAQPLPAVADPSAS